MDSRRTPQRVGNAHFTNKGANFGRSSWPTATRSRFPAPIGSEASAMPSHNCFGLKDLQRVQHVRHQAIETREHEPVDAVEDKSLRRLAPQHVELMTKHENFSVQRSAGLEQASHNAPNQPAEIAHRMRYHPIRRRRSAPLGLR